MVEYNDDGTEIRRYTHKDGNLVTAVAWKPNGEKCPVTDVVNGNGVRAWYNEDGTEENRYTYRDGKLQ